MVQLNGSASKLILVDVGLGEHEGFVEVLNAQALNDAVAAFIEPIGNRARSTPPSETMIARQPVADPQFFHKTDFAH